MDGPLPPGATPLRAEDREGLRVAATTRGELDQFEASNIADAVRWAAGNAALKRELLTVSGLQRLHRRMFGETWTWAGTFRRSATNIGIDWHQIPEQVRALCDDVAWRCEHATWPWPEIAVRFHHRLVYVHPFPNGNGRHARLAADLLLQFNRQPRLTWGGAHASLARQGDARDAYLRALREADAGSIEPLLAFATGRSEG
jgi:Fic-DOC domain mobile mystery protein B